MFEGFLRAVALVEKSNESLRCLSVLIGKACAQRTCKILADLAKVLALYVREMVQASAVSACDNCVHAFAPDVKAWHIV